ncbi:PqqD family protein [Desulfohalovibrio reitneri]|uniref:PqqD family protein n=1 Tax=Desulfohalovibrio reitneri TaxID=1307759 RepID=UPI0004A6DE7C|nr:PqqD family protein [Desulfohalovibrio reitneri]
MSLFRKKKPVQPTIPREEALASVPVRNRDVEEESGDDGLVLSYPTTLNPWFARMARKVGIWDGSPIQKKLQLDEMGELVWSWIDGQSSVAELSQKLAERYDLHSREAEVSMSTFLRELGRRGIVAFR